MFFFSITKEPWWLKTDFSFEYWQMWGGLEFPCEGHS